MSSSTRALSMSGGTADYFSFARQKAYDLYSAAQSVEGSTITFNNVQNEYSYLTVDAYQKLYAFATQQVALIEANFVVAPECHIEHEANWTQRVDGSWVSRGATAMPFFTQALERSARSRLPMGLFVLSKQNVTTRAYSRALRAIIGGFDESAQRYELHEPVRDSSMHYTELGTVVYTDLGAGRIVAPDLVTNNLTRKYDQMFVTGSMLNEWKILRDVCAERMLQLASIQKDVMTRSEIAAASELSQMRYLYAEVRKRCAAFMQPDGNANAHSLNYYAHYPQVLNENRAVYGYLIYALNFVIADAKGVTLKSRAAAARLNYDIVLNHGRMLSDHVVSRLNEFYDTSNTYVYQKRNQHSVGTVFRPTEDSIRRVTLYHTVCLSTSRRENFINRHKVVKSVYKLMAPVVKAVKQLQGAPTLENMQPVFEAVREFNTKTYQCTQRDELSLALTKRINKYMPSGTSEDFSAQVMASGVGFRAESRKVCHEFSSSGTPRGFTYISTLAPAQHIDTVTINGIEYLKGALYEWSDGSYRFKEEPPSIRGYHESKGYVGFIPTTQRSPWLGFELELEGPSSDDDDDDNPRTDAHLNLVAAKLRCMGNKDSDPAEYLSCESDGSLNFGFEIVSGYTGLDTHGERMRDILPMLEAKGMRKDTTTGLHVHLCKSGTSLRHVARIDKFLNSTSTSRLIRILARRDPNGYCKKYENQRIERRMLDQVRNYVNLNDSTRNKIRQHKDAKQRIMRNATDDNRYRFLNLNNNATMEFRMFAATTSYVEFMASLEFCYQLWHFTQFAKNSDLYEANFCKFISKPENRSTSRHLRQILAQHNYAVFVPNTNKKAIAA